MNKVFLKSFLFRSHLFANSAFRIPAGILARNYGDRTIYDVVEDVSTSGGHLPSRHERQAELFELNKLFPDVVRHLTEDFSLYDVEDANKWLAKALQYNMAGGTRSRGVALVESYKTLAGNDPSSLQKARILAWCLETMHTAVVMADDAMKGVQTRGGKPCWHLKKQLQHDISPRIIEAGIYKLLKFNFSGEPYYESLVELFQNGMGKVSMGQVLEREARIDRSLSKFTMERYAAITKYTASHLNFQLPVLLAMALAGIEDQEVYRQAKTILQEMGYLYQTQVDYVDCYGRGTGSSIEEGKCTWMAVVALQRVSDTQRQLFVECYGEKDPRKVATVRDIYSLVGVRSTYKRFQEINSELLLTQIQQVSRGLPHKLFLRFMKKSQGLNV